MERMERIARLARMATGGSRGAWLVLRSAGGGRGGRCRLSGH